MNSSQSWQSPSRIQHEVFLLTLLTCPELACWSWASPCTSVSSPGHPLLSSQSGPSGRRQIPVRLPFPESLTSSEGSSDEKAPHLTFNTHMASENTYSVKDRHPGLRNPAGWGGMGYGLRPYGLTRPRQQLGASQKEQTWACWETRRPL